jgi:hypothetical protein
MTSGHMTTGDSSAHSQPTPHGRRTTFSFLAIIVGHLLSILLGFSHQLLVSFTLAVPQNHRANLELVGSRYKSAPR